MMLICISFVVAIPPCSGEQKSGEDLFNRNCSTCHPKLNIFTGNRDVVRIMRNPPQYMPRFDTERISDKDAKMIEDYILRYHQ